MSVRCRCWPSPPAGRPGSERSEPAEAGPGSAGVCTVVEMDVSEVFTRSTPAVIVTIEVNSPTSRVTLSECSPPPIHFDITAHVSLETYQGHTNLV